MVRVFNYLEPLEDMHWFWSFWDLLSLVGARASINIDSTFRVKSVLTHSSCINSSTMTYFYFPCPCAQTSSQAPCFLRPQLNPCSNFSWEESTRGKQKLSRSPSALRVSPEVVHVEEVIEEENLVLGEVITGEGAKIPDHGNLKGQQDRVILRLSRRQLRLWALYQVLLHILVPQELEVWMIRALPAILTRQVHNCAKSFKYVIQWRFDIVECTRYCDSLETDMYIFIGVIFLDMTP